VEATRFLSIAHRAELYGVADKLTGVEWPVPEAGDRTFFSVADLLGAAPLPAAPSNVVVVPDSEELQETATPEKVMPGTADIFGAGWDPSQFAAEAAAQGGLGRLADKRRVDATKTPGKAATETLETPAKKLKVAKTHAREAIYAPGIGRLHLCLGERRSELTYEDQADGGKRRHLFTLDTQQLAEHAELACALVRLAATTSMSATDLRALKDEQLKEQRALMME
jgi:hypothetical protein